MANSPKSETGDDADDQAVIFTRGASGRVYGSKGMDGAEGEAPAPKKKIKKKIVKKKAVKKKKVAKKAAAKKAAPPKPAPKKPETLKEHSSVLAQTVVSSFSDRLTAEAKRKGGTLTLEDIEALNGEFEEKMVALETVFEASFKQFMKTQSESKSDELAPKSMPFNRLIVSRFARYFKEGLVSRRILPGFNMAVGVLLGEELLESYQKKCTAIMKRLGNGDENKCELKEYYYDDEAGAIAAEAQITMILHFQNFDRRINWFIGMINDHLLPPPDDADAKEKNYKLSPPAALMVLDTMLTDLKEMISTENGRLAVTKNHGVDTIIQIADTLQLIEDKRS